MEQGRRRGLLALDGARTAETAATAAGVDEARTAADVDEARTAATAPGVYWADGGDGSWRRLGGRRRRLPASIGRTAATSSVDEARMACFRRRLGEDGRVVERVALARVRR
jgi:hypothetical protein